MMMNFVIGKMDAVVIAGSGSKGTCKKFDEIASAHPSEAFTSNRGLAFNLANSARKQTIVMKGIGSNHRFEVIDLSAGSARQPLLVVDNGLVRLSPREKEVVRLLAKGFSSQEISEGGIFKKWNKEYLSDRQDGCCSNSRVRQQGHLQDVR